MTDKLIDPRIVLAAVQIERDELRVENERLRAALQTVRDHYRIHPQCCLVADQIAQDGLG